MSKRMYWDDHINTMRSYEGGDIEWVDERIGVLYRGQIKEITKSMSGDRMHIRLAWCAQLPIHSGGSWLYTAEQKSVSLFKEYMQKFYTKRGSNGQIEFETSEMKGSFYPKGQNLSPLKVREMPTSHKLRVVK